MFYTYRNQVPLAPGQQLAFQAGRGYYARTAPGTPSRDVSGGLSQQRDVTHQVYPTVHGTPYQPADQRGGGEVMPDDPDYSPGGIVTWGTYRPQQPTSSIQHRRDFIAQLRDRLAASGGQFPQGLAGGPLQLNNAYDLIRQAVAQRLLGY